jgi:predicted glycosyltransferase
MKVLIDILTPKQCMLFLKLSQRLNREGHTVFRTTREYREVNQLLRLKRMEAQIVGKHGGAELTEKLEASTRRILELAPIVAELRPDVAVSFASPETSRVAFGLHIPHICLNDSPHSEAIARLTVPLATVLITPKLIPKTAWTKFGIQPHRIIQYNAIDPWAWLRDFEPNRKILEQLGLTKSKPIVAFRAEESFASYLPGRASKPPSWIPLLKTLLQSRADVQAVVLPRYETQVSFLTEKFGRQAVVCKTTIDAPSLLAHTSVFVGAGGTMTAEAALLGVPTFSCYPGTPFLIEDYLVERGLVIRETDCGKLRTKMLKTLDNIESVRKTRALKARQLTSSFEDPIDVIVKAIKKVS